MTEMHSFLQAKQLELPSPAGERTASVRGLFELLYQIGQWVETRPLACRRGEAEANALYVWFNDVVFAEDEFWQVFGEYLVLLRTRWSIDLFGTAGQSQETVWLTLQEEEGRVYAVEKTLSGHPADTVESLCLRIRCPSSEQSEMLYALVSSGNWSTGTTALDWKYGLFLLEETLAAPTHNSCFCYGSLWETMKGEDALQALDFQKKVSLWTGFLKFGFDYAEFEWLYDAISEGVVSNRMEWELSLHTAMENLKYSIQVSPHDFELYDGQGSRRYYSFNSTSYAERAFLKILFPLTM